MTAIIDLNVSANKTIEVKSPAGDFSIVFRAPTLDERATDSAMSYEIEIASWADRVSWRKQRLFSRLGAAIDWRDVRGPDGKSIEFSADRLRALMAIDNEWLGAIAAAINSFWSSTGAPVAAEQAPAVPPTEQAA